MLALKFSSTQIILNLSTDMHLGEQMSSQNILASTFFFIHYVCETALNTRSYPFSHITVCLLPKLSWRMFLSPLAHII